MERPRRSLEGADGCFLYSLTFEKEQVTWGFSQCFVLIFLKEFASFQFCCFCKTFKILVLKIGKYKRRSGLCV